MQTQFPVTLSSREKANKLTQLSIVRWIETIIWAIVPGDCLFGAVGMARLASLVGSQQPPNPQKTGLKVLVLERAWD